MRSRSAGRFFVLALLAALAGGAGCSPDGSVPPLALPSSATDLGLLETNPVIRGRDGGYSGLFQGRSVWLYGDTILAAAAADGRSWRHNSWSFTSDLDSSDGISGFQERLDSAGAPVEFFPQTEAERAFNDLHFVDDCTAEPCGARWAIWPGAMVTDTESDRAIIFYHKIYAEPGEFNFEGVGSSLAGWEDFDAEPQRPLFHPDAEHPTLLFPKPAPSFGSAALILSDHLYAYGCQLKDMDKPCLLARVPLAGVLDPAAWRYFGGDGEWLESWEEAVPLFSGNDMMTVSWNASAGAWIAFYSQPMDRIIRMRSAPQPEGPWSRATTVFMAEKPESGDWVYDALAHPELEREAGGTVVLTYSRSTGFLQSEVRVVEVTIQSVE